MAVTYGFYNSVNHDRVYDAVQVSSLFDGLISDGVYETIGDKLMVKPLSDNTVTVGTGRAWFDHTWTLNDALYPISLNSAGVVNPRYDAIVLEVDSSTRVNSIKALYGTEAVDPSKPALTNNDSVHQYPLAYIRRNAGSAAISQSDIENMVGTSACPFVIGIIEVMTIDDIVAQWSAQWDDYLTSKGNQFNSWLAESQLEFTTWFNELQNQLDDNQAANLQNQINDLSDLVNALVKGEAVLQTIDDSDGNPIQDYLGNNLEGGVIYVPA